MNNLGIYCPNPNCGKEMLVGQDGGKILCIACHKYWKLIPAEIGVPGEP